MPRSPKGVVTRNQPEWNSQNLYWGGSIVPSTGTGSGYAGFSLWNSSQGQSLVVWGCEFTLALPATASPGLPPSGVICWDSKPISTITYNPLYGFAPHQLGTIPIAQWGTYGSPSGPSGLTQFEVISFNNGYWSWTHNFPMLTLPPGYAFVILGVALSTVASAVHNNCSILFEAVNHPYP